MRPGKDWHDALKHARRVKRQGFAVGVRTTAREILDLRAVGEDLCDGCGATILPDVCGCGSELRQHLFSGGPSFDGHPFVPMGCNCYRDTGTGGGALIRFILRRRCRDSESHCVPLKVGHR